jgi:hypothetical protein
MQYSILISTDCAKLSNYPAGNSRYDAMINAKVMKAATKCFLFMNMVVMRSASVPSELMCQVGIYTNSCPKRASRDREVGIEIWRKDIEKTWF